MAENCDISKNVKKVLFFVFIKKVFFGQDSFKIFLFYIIPLHFQVFLAILKIRLNDVEIMFFIFNGYSLIIMGI